MACHFITFVNHGFMNPEKILKQAESFECFESVECYNEDKIKDYVKKHQKFIKREPYGFGRFIWKPHVILDKLLSISEGDYLVYSDAGMALNINGRERLMEYFDALKFKSCVIFKTTDFYTLKQFVKADAIMKYAPELAADDMTYCYAGLMILKKTNYTLKFINEWLGLCENYQFLDRTKSKNHKEFSEFKAQDADNGLFCLCVYKNQSIAHFIDAKETNIYTSEGLQVQHLPKYHPSNIDWSPLDSFPFQYRRDTPKFSKPD
jgi:hypothetical protein